MSDREDTPPPLPASPPPPPMEESELTTPPPKRRTSEKILELQKILRENGGLGMYNSSSPAPPPSATTTTSFEEWQPLKLSHATKNRPKRKVRPPSRNSSLSKDGFLETATPTPKILAVEEEDIIDVLYDEPPPPLPPMSAPPGAPPSPPVSDTESLDNEVFAPKENLEPLTSTPIETTAKPFRNSAPWSDVIESKKLPKTSPIVATKGNTSTPNSVQTKRIVIGSFSDRLKKLRERRMTKTNSNSSLPSTLSPSTTTTSLQSEEANTTETYPSSPEHLPKMYSTTESSIQWRSPTPGPLPPSSKQPKHFPPFGRKEVPESDEDELPPAPPPPIPELPPPPEEVDPVRNNTPAKSHTLSSKVSFRTSQWKDDWTRKSEQLQLDSFKSDNLPLLGLDAVHRPAAPMEEILETPHPLNALEIDASSLSGSVPSLPDSLPPELPETPPPTLPENPPPILPKAPPPVPESFQVSPLDPSKMEHLTPSLRSLETSTPNSNQDYSLSVVKLRERKFISPSTDTGTKRRSAFDALVNVEPNTEERNKPKLSLEERRKLTIRASKLSSADTDTAHQVWNRQTVSSHGTPAANTPQTKVWNRQTVSSHGTPAANTPQTNRSDQESKASIIKSEPNHSMDSLKSSQPSSKNESPDMRTKEHSPVSSNEMLDLNSSSGSTSYNIKRKDAIELQQKSFSLPPTSGTFQQIRVISEGTPPSSPDVRYTRVAKESWSPKVKQPKKFVRDDDDLSASASTGNILPAVSDRRKKKKRWASLEKTSSMDSFGSSNSSPKSSRTTPWSIFKKSSSNKGQGSHPMSPLTAASVANPSPGNIPKSPTSISLESDDSNDGTRSNRPTKNKFFPSNSPSNTPRTFTGSIGSKENILTQQIPDRDPGQEEKMEVQLTKVKEQSKMTLEYLRKDPVAFLRRQTPRGSPRLRPGSMILGTEIYKIDPAKWTVDQVCKWLELVGLGSYRAVFRERNVTGKRLLQLDIQLFDELDIDSPEIREIFLAKIYELSNPSSEMEVLEDDFKLSVEEYTSEDWKKFEAAVNALKGNVLDNTIELEASAIGQFIHTGYVRSQSTPNFADLDELGPDESQEYTTEQHKMAVSMDTRTLQNREVSSSVSQQQESSYVNAVLHNDTDNDWVAELPTIRRKRALTEPIPVINIETVNSRRPPDCSYTLPRHRLSAPEAPETTIDPKRRIVKKKSMSPRQLSISEDLTLELGVSTSDRRRSSTSTQCLVKLFMDTVQEGALYKSFLISPTTTSDDLVAMALDKAYLGDNCNPQQYTIWDRDKDTSSRSSLSRQLRTDESPMMVKSQWRDENSRFFELRLKEGIQLHPTPTKRKMSSLDVGDFETQIRSLTEEKNQLLGELSVFHSELIEKGKVEQQLELVSEECATVKARYKSEQLSHNRVLSEMKGRLQQLGFEKTKVEDQITIMSAASGGGKVSSGVLMEIQSKYSKTVDSLKMQLTERGRDNEELMRKNITLDQEVVELRHDSEELRKMSRLLREHQQELSSAEHKLAEKEDTIHGLRGQLERSQVSVQQAAALQESLQALELTSRQQQDLSSRTVMELKEQVSRMTAELGRREQQMMGLRKERERLTRERRTKDNVATSLEADLASYRMMVSPRADESERILTLQRSISVHEVALASLQSEYNQQTAELLEAEKEVSKFRDALAKKEEQLVLVSSSQEHHSKSTLYSLLDTSTSYQLVLVELNQERGGSPQEPVGRLGVERSLSEAYGIKVSGLLGNCAVSEVNKEAAKAGLRRGDRLLEINGMSVFGLTQREINTLLKKQSQEGALRMVTARPADTRGEEANRQGSMDDELVDRYKKLNISLSHQLESQTSEVDRWRNECERIKAEISTSNKDQNSESPLLEASVLDLRSQLKNSERARVQLRETLDRLEGVTKEQLKDRERELVLLVEATERAASARIQHLEAEKQNLMKTLREHLTNTGDSPPTPGNSPPTPPATDLTAAPRNELLTRLAEREKDLAKNRAYLDQLLSVVIDQEPQLLARVGEAQLLRDQNEVADACEDWC